MAVEIPVGFEAVVYLTPSGRQRTRLRLTAAVDWAEVMGDLSPEYLRSLCRAPGYVRCNRGRGHPGIVATSYRGIRPGIAGSPDTETVGCGQVLQQRGTDH